MKYIHIQEQHKAIFIETVSALFDRYHHRIDQAYTENDNDLTVQFTLKIQPNKYDGIDLVTAIAFTAEKIKDSLKNTVFDRQRELPLKPRQSSPLRPPGRGPGYTEGQWRRLRDYQHH